MKACEGRDANAQACLGLLGILPISGEIFVAGQKTAAECQDGMALWVPQG